jgi:hypothetical protein
MRPIHARRPAGVAAVLMLGLLHAPVGAQPEPSFERLRPVDVRARNLLQEAWRGSETVRGLVETLETSDLIVVIEVRAQEVFRGRVRFLGASSDYRWVHVAVKVPGDRQDLLCTLAHELQHVVEIAQEPDVRDPRSVEALFSRIGFRVDERRFETEAALALEQRVRLELSEDRTVR